jgi:hypothetical protein
MYAVAHNGIFSCLPHSSGRRDLHPEGTHLRLQLAFSVGQHTQRATGDWPRCVDAWWNCAHFWRLKINIDWTNRMAWGCVKVAF